MANNRSAAINDSKRDKRDEKADVAMMTADTSEEEVADAKLDIKPVTPIKSVILSAPSIFDKEENKSIKKIMTDVGFPVDVLQDICLDYIDPEEQKLRKKIKENMADMNVDLGLPDVLHNLILGYTADQDSTKEKSKKEKRKKEKREKEKRAKEQKLNLIIEEKKEEKIRYSSGTTFFEKTLAQRLHEAADDLVLGYGDKALALVNESPWVLWLKTQGHDRFGTCIEGTLLEIAAMAGDVNLRELKKGEEDHGMVELLKKAGKLSEEEVAKQLYSVLFSDEAKAANEARKKDVLDVLKEFGESLIRMREELPENWDTIEEFKATQEKCRVKIEKLRTDLVTIVSNQTITTGYILDSYLIVELNEWFKQPENLNRFGSDESLISDLFWTHIYGAFQYVSPAREIHVHRIGIGRVVDKGVIPPRLLKNSDGSSHFSTGSLLGLDFYVGYYGVRGGAGVSPGIGVLSPPVFAFGEFISSKNKRVAMLCTQDISRGHRVAVR
jgi:hypothetical protein